MSQFNSESYPECLAVATEEDFSIISLDDIQKLHIHTHPLGESPRRIAFHPGKRSLCVGTLDQNSAQSFLRLIDEQTLETLSSFSFEASEEVSAVSTFTLNNTTYFVVGSCYQEAGAPEPMQGRILTFNVDDGKLILEASERVAGAVYSLVQRGNNLVVTVNGLVQIFESALSLKLLTQHSGHIAALSVATRGENILVADLMRSVSVLAYEEKDNQLTEISRDYDPDLVCSIAMLDEENYLSAEMFNNLSSFKLNVDDELAENRLKLEATGRFHLGDVANTMKPGSLVMGLPDVPRLDSILLGSVSGGIYVVASLPPEEFQFATSLQTALRKVIKGIGGFSNVDWRAFRADRRHFPAAGFVDGDLVEEFLNLPVATARQVAQELKLPFEQVTAKVEALSRALH